jgi:hypothetical protein
MLSKWIAIPTKPLTKRETKRSRRNQGSAIKKKKARRAHPEKTDEDDEEP